MDRRFTVQLLDRATGRWLSWDFNLALDVAKVMAAHARERGETTRIVPYDAGPELSGELNGP